jgi:hypothetical protein
MGVIKMALTKKQQSAYQAITLKAIAAGKEAASKAPNNANRMACGFAHIKILDRQFCKWLQDQKFENISYSNGSIYPVGYSGYAQLDNFCNAFAKSLPDTIDNYVSSWID